MTKPRTFRRVPLPAAVSLLLAILLAGFYTVLCLWIQPNSLRAVLKVFQGQELLIVLNALPIGLTILAAAFLLRNVFAASAIVGGLWAVLSLANRIKIEVRDEPVFPRDFGLLKEVGSAVGEYAIHWPWSVIAVIVAVTVVMLLLAAVTESKPFPIAALRHRWAQVLGAAACIAALIGCILTVYASNPRYNAFRTSNPYYVPSVFNELGFPYCFCHHFTTYTVDRPEGYSRGEAEGWDSAETVPGGKDVHVIMVMNEAFSDLTDDPAFTYSAEDDPLKNLHAVQNSRYCLSGRIVVPGFAGGTANTEFDVLTGMQTNALSATTTSAFRAVNNDLDSLFRVYREDGYRTLFMHPGDDWFYNRENVYRWFGAEETLFADEMTGLTSKGRWVTDDCMADLILQQLQYTMDRGKTLFNYTTTIQNHMSYTRDKYGADYVFPPVQTSAALSDQAETLVSVYVEGLRDADAMLGKLTTALSQVSEPVVLVFFGDHLPYLGDNQLAYAELGMEVALPENQRDRTFCSYETPYVIWGNEAAGAALDWDAAAQALELPEDGTISACYLGAAVLEFTDRRQTQPWFAFLNDVRRELPVIQKRSALVTGKGVQLQNTLSADQQQLIHKLRCWSYYKLKQKAIP